MTDAPNPIGAAIAANQSHTFQDDDRGDCCECGQGIAHQSHRPDYQDEAALQLAGMISTHPPLNEKWPDQAIPLARFILTAIRAGKVPGIYTNESAACRSAVDEARHRWRSCGDAVAQETAQQIADLRAKLEDANQYRNGHLPTCAGMDMARMICDCGYLDGTAYRELLSERDMYKLGMEDAQHNKQSALTAMNVEAERADKALAELAAEREAHKLERGAREHTWTRLGKVVEDRDAARAEADSLRFQMKSWIAANGPGGWIDNLRNKCASLHDLIASKDNEIAALRARSVRLPGRESPPSCLDYTDGMRGYNRCLDDCSERIRAAGVKVEGFCHV